MGWFARAFRRGGAPTGRDADVSARRALLALLEHDPDRADAELSAAARVHTHDVELFRALALLHRQQGDFARAIQIHQGLLLRRDLAHERRIEVLGELAEDFRKAGFIRRAAAAFEEVLIHAPRDPRALRGLAALLRTLRDHGRALEMTRRLAKAEGRRRPEDEAILLVEQGEAAHAEGRSDDARQAARRARRLYRGHAPAHILLGTLEAERGRNKAAIAAWREAVELDPRSGAFVYPRLEAAFAAAGRAREFEPFLRGVLEKRPDDTAVRIALARALAAWGEVDAAVAELRNLLERQGGSLEARASLLRVLLDAGREQEALAALPGLLERLEGEGPGARRESSE